MLQGFLPSRLANLQSTFTDTSQSGGPGWMFVFACWRAQEVGGFRLRLLTFFLRDDSGSKRAGTPLGSRVFVEDFPNFTNKGVLYIDLYIEDFRLTP